MKKRLLSMILAVSMVLTFLPVSAITAFADDVPATGTGYGPSGDLQIDNYGYPYYGLTASEQDIKHDTYDASKTNAGNGWAIKADYDGTTAALNLYNGEFNFGENTEINCLISVEDLDHVTIKSGIFKGNRIVIESSSSASNPTFKISGGSFYCPLSPVVYPITIYGGIFYGNLYDIISGSKTYFHAGISKTSPSEGSTGHPDFGSSLSGCKNIVYHLTAENCSINGIEGSAYVATCSDAQPTVTVSGAGYLKDCKVQLSDGSTKTLTEWGAKNIICANGLVSFTAPTPTESKSTIQEITLVPETVDKKTVQLPTNISDITVKVSNDDGSYTDVTIPANRKLSVPLGKYVTITAPALTDANKKYQWLNNGVPAMREVSEDGRTYGVTVLDDVTIGLEIVDKTPEIPEGGTNSTTLKNALLKKVVSDKQDITDSIQKNADGSYNIPIGAKVTVAFDKSAFADSGSKFSYWKITGLTQDEANQYNKQESFTFIMPENAVTLEAMTQDDSIDDTTAEILGTAAIIGTAVVGTAVLAYSGHQLGTELYLTYLLPSGAVIPANRIQLAMLLWQDAGNPAPAAEPAYSDIDADDTDAQNAAQWAVETGLMELPDADNAPGQFDPYASVSHTQVIHAWKKAQSVKG